MSFLFSTFIGLEARAQTTVPFSYTGSVQTFTVPCGVYTLHIKAWGGGGSGGGKDSYIGAPGGGSGFVQSDIAVIPGQTLNVIVGGGGGPGGNCAPLAPGGTGGWGNGVVNGGRGGISGDQGCSGGGGAGGGGSGIYNGVTPLLVAGGGGGGSGGGNHSAGASGGGGGQNGNAAPGSCSAIGIAGASATGNGTQGGDRGFGNDGAGGGGGGGGNNGGTGGAAPSSCDCGGCGGGGGNGWSSGTSTIITNGNGQTPGNNAYPDLPGGAAIGGYNSAGGNGFLMLTYLSGIPIASFTNTTVCFGNTTQFTDNSTVASGTISSWGWNFGDGNTSTGQNPAHTYTASGTYSVTLIVVTTYSCVGTITNVVDVYQKPVANFSATTVCLGNATLFTDLTTGGATVWSWNLGDGNTSAIQNPVHTYTASGTYSVSLITTTANGCMDTVAVPVIVNPLPVASFSTTPVCVNVPPTHFTDYSSGASTWSWSFGDPASGPNNTSVQTSPSHTYTLAGNYSVTLVVTTSQGCTDTMNQNITVNPTPVPVFTAPNNCFNTLSVFTDQSTTATGNITSWNWNFGDGNTDTIKSPTHTYNAAGTYTVTLILINSFGCTDTIQKNIYIKPLPVSTFSATSVCVGTSTCFKDLSTISTGSVTAWGWNFNDPTSGNNISNLQNPCHVFTSANTFTVTLTVTSDSGCQSTTVLPVVVNPFPVAGFTVPNTCLGNANIFTNTSSALATQWSWDFGDGSPTVTGIKNPSHVYAGAGTYMVTQIVTSSAGCKDTLMNAVTVYPLPVVNFTSDSVCLGYITKFTDSSYIVSGNIMSWFWNFGDGDTSTLQNPTHAYSNYGTFNAVLTVTSNNGCVSSVTLPVIVHRLPIANFSYIPSNITLVDNVAFTDLTIGGAVQWFWNFGDTITDSTQSPSHVYSNVGTYTVMLIVATQYGCKDTVKRTLEVNQYAFYIPNSFTPNADGVNDFFFGQGVGIVEYEFFIFDRWGDLIFYCHVLNDLPQTPACQWDGKVHGGDSGKRSEQDVYVWKATLTNAFKKEFNFTGNVTMIR